MKLTDWRHYPYFSQRRAVFQVVSNTLDRTVFFKFFCLASGYLIEVNSIKSFVNLLSGCARGLKGNM